MKVNYNKNDDILMIELSHKKIDDAYETGNMIVHVAQDKEPVLLEIFKGSELLEKAAGQLPKDIIKRISSL